MLRLEPKQLSFHSVLYNKIPENHTRKAIYSVVDFGFINELLENRYCKQFGRPAKEPEMMCKLLFRQRLYNLSDEKVIEEASLNLAYLYFLDIKPEGTLPNKNLLIKMLMNGNAAKGIQPKKRNTSDKKGKKEAYAKATNIILNSNSARPVLYMMPVPKKARGES